MLVLDSALVLFVARGVEAITHGLVLKVAFSALVTYRAVQRVIDQKEFHDPLARLLDAVGVGTDDHALAGRHGAGGNGLRGTFHVDKAHPAVAGDRQSVVIAEARDLDAGFLAGMQNGGAVLDLDLDAIHCQLRHDLPPIPPLRRPPPHDAP